MLSELQVPKPNVPRMPFSSPIADDALSPTHSAFSHLGQPWRRRYGSEARKDQMDLRYDDTTRRLSPGKKSKPSPRDIPKQQGMLSSRPRPPELNLVTSFTKSPPNSGKSAKHINLCGRVQEQIESTPGFIAEAEAKNDRSRGTSYTGETLQAKDSISRKPNRLDGMKGPVGSLKRSNSSAMEISPSDRTLVIGMSVPSSKLAEYITNPESAVVKSGDLPEDRYGDRGHHQTMPNNSLTPAKVAIPRLAVPDSDATWKRRRAASSVYSQATLYARGASVIAKVAPMPPPPLPTIRHAHENYPIDNEDRILGSRITSWETEFDEDEKQRGKSNSRPHSGDSQIGMINRSSSDTFATRHRSQGWWNHILSPFLTRSNTLLTKHSPTDEQEQPPLPKLSPKSKGYQYIAELEDSSSQVPKQINPEIELYPRRSGRSSIWTDPSRQDAERRTTGFVPEDVTHRNLEPSNIAREPSVVVGPEISPEFEPFSGLGAAAEYFEASWHDQNSDTPFFECQNHGCFTKEVLTKSKRENKEASRNLFNSPEGLGRDVRPDEKGVFHQTPPNRFSAAFGEAKAAKKRPNSDITEFEDDPESTPELEEALVAPMVRVGPPVPAIQQAQSQNDKTMDREPQKATLPSTQASTPQRPLYSPQKLKKSAKGYQAVLPLEHPRAAPDPPVLKEPPFQNPRPVIWPEPVEDTVHSTDLLRDTQLQAAQNTYHIHQYYGYPRLDQDSRLVASPKEYPPPPQTSGRVQKQWETSEEKVDKSRKFRESNESKSDSCYGRFRPNDKKKGRRFYCCIISGLLVIIVLVLVLALTLTRRREDMPVESSLLNLTGYPPIPTGVSTVARPDAVLEESRCVQPSTMWSCAVPKEQQASIAPSDPDQPNFRIEIRFENGTRVNTTISSQMGKRMLIQPLNTVSSSNFTRNQILQLRDSFTSSLFTPNPAPPSQQDQAFLGNTTDEIVAPFDGEFTPFFISLLAATPISTQFLKRQDTNSTNSTDPFPDVTGTIPAPDLNPNGTAAAANLLPFPSAQPLRLYNRGLTTEHYGFYNYFDRSIFLKSTALIDTNSTSVGEVPDDENGGSPEDAATVRCTWAQTRFLVQIWTNMGSSATLLPSITNTSLTSTTSSQSATQARNATTSSANDFSRPGSFPYPISITLDRHGGNLQNKEIYCYGLDNREQVITGEKKIQLENRGVGGVLVNPALGPFGNVNVSLADGGPGGIDGGSGGCGCQWRNWEAS